LKSANISQIRLIFWKAPIFLKIRLILWKGPIFLKSAWFFFKAPIFLILRKVQGFCKLAWISWQQIFVCIFSNLFLHSYN
jgi:hypothetical protein